MANMNSSTSIWVVVEVQSGIPVRIKAFSGYDEAEKYSESLRFHLNPDNDETGVFEINLAETRNS